MPGHEHHAIADRLVGDGDGLFGVARIVHDEELELLAKDAAGGVDVLHHHFGAAPELLAEGRVLAGHGTGRGDGDFGLGRG